MNINATVIGQLISFFVFVWICYKYIWPPIVKAMDERKEKIAAGLAAAEDAQKSLVDAQARSEDLTKDAKQQSLEIISDAKKRANAMIEEAKADAKLEADRQIAMARSEIEQETQRAKDELRQKLSALVLAATTQIVEREVDGKAHSDLLDKLSKQL